MPDQTDQTDLNDLLARIPTDQVAARLGVDRGTADAAIRTALPALLGGMSANAQDPARASSLAGALDRHDPGLVDGGVDLDQVDPQEGQKIVGHVFGDHTEPVVDRLGGAGGGVSRELMAKLLPLLAPIVMSYLAKRLGRSSGAAGGAGGLADILGSLLGGGSGGAAPGTTGGSAGGSAGGIDLGSVLGSLGGLLGGGRR